MPLLRIVRIGNRAIARIALGLPLVCACGTLVEFPLIFEKCFEECVVPLRRSRRPDAFQSAGDGVRTDAGLVAVLPAETHVFEQRALRLRTDVACARSAVGLAKGVSACDQRDRLVVIHRHAAEGLANVARGLGGIRIAVGTLGVHIDKTHLHRGQRICEFAIALVTLVAQPCSFRTPVDVEFRLPDIRATAAEAEGLEPHGLERDVAGEDHQVAP